MWLLTAEGDFTCHGIVRTDEGIDLAWDPTHDFGFEYALRAPGLDPMITIDASYEMSVGGRPGFMNTSRPFAESVLRFYRRAHARVLKLAEEVSPGQFAWSAGPSLHSIAWQVWHVARWDDFFAAHFMADFGREPHTEVWEREGVAAAWSLTAGALGQHDAGTGLNDAEAESVQLPDQDRVLDYARKAFAFAESAVEAMDGKLEEMAKDDRDGDTNLDNVYNYYEHLSRHLGMIEAIKGLQGLAGTATR